MVYIRVRLYGSGTDADPFRTRLPCTTLVWQNPDTMRAIVDVPSQYFPQTVTDNAIGVNIAGIDKPVIVALGPILRAVWLNHLRKLWPRRVGEYDDEVI